MSKISESDYNKAKDLVSKYQLQNNRSLTDGENVIDIDIFDKLIEIKHPVAVDIDDVVFLITNDSDITFNRKDAKFERVVVIGYCGDDKFVRTYNGKERTLCYKAFAYKVIDKIIPFNKSFPING